MGTFIDSIFSSNLYQLRIVNGCPKPIFLHGHHWISLQSMTFMKIVRKYVRDDNYRYIFFIFRTFAKWTNGNERPKNGSLIRLVTKDNNTDLIVTEQ